MWCVATATSWVFTPMPMTLGNSLMYVELKDILPMFFLAQSFNVMDKSMQNEAVASAKGLAKFFAIDITIKIFGQTIWEYHFPPKSN